jgi:hypothetical protein
MQRKKMISFNEEEMARILDKLDRIDNKIHDIDKTLVRNTADLEKHMLRTEQNEEMIKIMSDDVKPIKKHVAHMEGALKLAGVVAILAGIAKSFGIL